MSELLPDLGWFSQAAVVVLAFSALIFVHELGHYLAARVTGVRVERFFIGFDVFGLAVKKKYKGTVYGIGILPLGGYCALAGQNDDPRKERRTGAPDELQSKSLPARALVFGGGVLMNFLFGFLVLVAAYIHGIPFIPPVLGKLDPTGPAAIHGFRTGDRILRVDGQEVGSFEEAAEAIALSGAGGEIDVEIERRDRDGALRNATIRVKGRGSDARGNLNSIGADPERSRIVAGMVQDPAFTDRMAGRLAVGDEIVAVDGVEIYPNQGQIIQDLAADRPGEEIRVTVKNAADGAEHEIDIPLETYGEWDMGLRVGVRIVDVMPGGPAARAGLKPGDLVVAYQKPGMDEPRRMVTVNEFRYALGDVSLMPVAIEVNRDGERLAFDVKPYPMPGRNGVEPGSDTLLGVLGSMEGDAGFLVETVLPGAPVEGMVRPGDYLVGIAGAPLPKGKSLGEAVDDAAAKDMRIFVSRAAAKDEILPPPRGDVPDANYAMWLSPRMNVEHRRPMIGVELTTGPVVAVEPDSFADTALGGAKRLVGARLAVLQYSPDLRTTILRFIFPENSPVGGGLKTLIVETPKHIRDNPKLAGLKSRLPISLKTAEEVRPLPFLPAVAAAGRKWVDLSLMVYRVLHKLVVRTLPIDAVGGPVQLFRIIKSADERGFAYFLYIVALISVNLGVCNLLPFPVLDGGHLVFLLVEWVIGRPPPLKVREAAQWVGLACLLALMLTVTGYDLMYLFTGGG